MRKVLLHIGYPRCGSTSTQKYFSKLDYKELTYFENKNNKFFEEYMNIKKSIFFLDDEKFNFQKKNIINFFDKYSKNFNIISDEAFLYPTNYILVDINRTLKRFCEIFKLINCKINILINIRNPKSLHLSYFTEMYHRILQYTKTIDTFDKYFDNYDHKIIKRIFDTFNFYKIYKIINEMGNNFIPNKNFFLIPLENLNQELSKVINEIFFLHNTQKKQNNVQKLNYSKKKENYYIRNYDWACFFLKYDPYHKIIPYSIQKILKNVKILNSIFFLNKIKSSLDPKKKLFIDNIYKKDLQIIEKIFNIDLKKYDYY